MYILYIHEFVIGLWPYTTIEADQTVYVPHIPQALALKRDDENVEGEGDVRIN